MRRTFAFVLGFMLAVSTIAGERVPTERWMRFVDPAAAGFDAAKLEAARATWESLPSSAFLVVADGAVVAAWGDVERRFMCHSVRKSFMSALYGIFWDQQKIELNKTLADLGIDDQGDGLLETEKRARILDLLKARSGIFHPAAYAGRTDSQPRGSQGPGRYFAYNNWDFNTLVTILEQETGAKVFEAFDEHFGQPLQMEDWRVSDGYYHYERDKSMHPAYPFRLSARDAARFGLVFARGGKWDDQRVLSRSWVQRSTALYSIDNDVFGYGMLWWVAREPRFEQYGFVAALGVGSQMIAVLPGTDMVIVNRANTYQGENTPRGGLLDLIEEVLQARTGEPVSDPKLIPLEPAAPDPRMNKAPAALLAEYAGEWPYPPAPLQLQQRTTVTITVDDGTLVTKSPVSGTFRTYLQPDGSLLQEDSLELYVPIRAADGTLAGISDADGIVNAALAAAVAGDTKRGASYLALARNLEGVSIEVTGALLEMLDGNAKKAETALGQLAERTDARRVEAIVNAVGYQFIGAEQVETAKQVFELNTRLFPEGANTWDSLAEAHMTLGNDEEAIRFYTKSLELNPDNSNAGQMIARIKGSEE